MKGGTYADTYKCFQRLLFGKGKNSDFKGHQSVDRTGGVYCNRRSIGLWKDHAAQLNIRYGYGQWGKH